MNGFSKSNINRYDNENTIAWNPKLLTSCDIEMRKKRKMTIIIDEFIDEHFFREMIGATNGNGKYANSPHLPVIRSPNGLALRMTLQRT